MSVALRHELDEHVGETEPLGRFSMSLSERQARAATVSACRWEQGKAVAGPGPGAYPCIAVLPEPETSPPDEDAEVERSSPPPPHHSEPCDHGPREPSAEPEPSECDPSAEIVARSDEFSPRLDDLDLLRGSSEDSERRVVVTPSSELLECGAESELLVRLLLLWWLRPLGTRKAGR